MFHSTLITLIPRIRLDDKKDYADSGTKDFDRMAFRYLCMVFFPLTLCYCIYSAIYSQHKSFVQPLIIIEEENIGAEPQNNWKSMNLTNFLARMHSLPARWAMDHISFN